MHTGDVDTKNAHRVRLCGRRQCGRDVFSRTL